MAELPSGTVTFLFTDIEGSTRRWEEHREAMQAAVARHDALLRAVVAEHEGSVFKTGGDAIYAVFSAAPQAVAATLDGQQRLAGEDWGEVTPLRVRMALHTGTAEERDGDYFGPPLNRVARMLSAGAGGQVLISGATTALVRDRLPSGAGLIDLGLHRFRDLSNPEQVFQLTHPDLAADFPAIKSLANRPHNLPVQMTSFVGREMELARVKELLASSRLLTLTGTGGSGKTRLAIEAAADLLDDYTDGVWFVDLAPLSQPDLVPQSVASVLGLRDEPGQPILNTLRSAIGTKRQLIVLDNCEHLVEACARVADALTRSCPQLSVLSTSREALAIAGETTWRVPPLSVADPEALPPADELTQYAAVQLFIERAVTAKPDFAVTNVNAPAIAQICHRLDGIPLAIELAAARIRVLSPDQIAERLDDRFRLLTSGSRTALPRQQTLRALVEWSYDLLQEPEKVLLRRLSVFAGGWTLAAAESVCAGMPVEDYEVLDLLSALVDKSLVLADDQPDGHIRYRFLETIRQFGAEQLHASGDKEELGLRHATHFAAAAREWEAGLYGPSQVKSLALLDTEYGNIRAALAWAAAAPTVEQRSLGAYLALSLGYYWFIRAAYDEGRKWMQFVASDQVAALERNPGILGWGGVELPRCEEELGICGPLYQGFIEWSYGEFRSALANVTQALQLAEKVGLSQWIAVAQFCAAFTGQRMGDLSLFDLLDQAEPVLAANGQRWLTGFCRQARAHRALNEGDVARALHLYAESLAIFRELGETRSIGVTLCYLGVAKLQLGQRDEAAALLQESLPIFVAVGERRHESDALARLGTVALLNADRAAAAGHWQRSLQLRSGLGDRRGIAESFESVATLASQERTADGVTLVASASSLRESTAAQPASHEQQQLERLLATNRECLGQPAFEAAWDKGLHLPLDEALSLALSLLPIRPER